MGSHFGVMHQNTGLKTEFQSCFSHEANYVTSLFLSPVSDNGVPNASWMLTSTWAIVISNFVSEMLVLHRGGDGGHRGGDGVTDSLISLF